MYLKAAIFVLSFLILIQCAAGQSLPPNIRGYKVESAELKISQLPKDTPGQDHVDVFVILGTPVISMAGLLAAKVEITGEFVPVKQSGKVDFLTFHDVKVNGIPIDVEEYKHTFAFKKSETTVLRDPARGMLRFTGIAKAAYAELTGSKEDWRLTGTVFVYGKFRKFGFNFKRVVPIKLDLTVKNPFR